ncbi:MAG: hypothetical protein ACOYVF_09500 [Candidatus Zixiibacteriota bacterium]
MSKNKSFRSCPRCGSRNLHIEQEEGKDRLLIICEDCDEIIEMHNKGFKGTRPSKRENSKDNFESDDYHQKNIKRERNRRGKSW